jgi:hypothetical protein
VVIVLKVLCYIDDSNSNSDSNEIDDAAAVRNSSSQTFFIAFERGFAFGPDTKTCYLVKPEGLFTLVCLLGGAVVFNFLLGLVSWWKCYANNYLHWGALATWLLLLIQGKKKLCWEFGGVDMVKAKN